MSFKLKEKVCEYLEYATHSFKLQIQQALKYMLWFNVKSVMRKNVKKLDMIKVETYTIKQKKLNR